MYSLHRERANGNLKFAQDSNDALSNQKTTLLLNLITKIFMNFTSDSALNQDCFCFTENTEGVKLKRITKPIRIPPIRYPPEKREAVEDALEQMALAGIIGPAYCSFSAPGEAFPGKNDDRVRITLNFKDLKQNY